MTHVHVFVPMLLHVIRFEINDTVHPTSIRRHSLSFSSLEMLDKVEPPSIPEGYAMSVAFSALLDLVRGITSMIERELSTEEEAAAEFRETHPEQQWQPQHGKDGRRSTRANIT